MDLTFALGLLALAAAVGCYGTIIGAGGGFLLVLGLVLVFDLEGAEAVGTAALVLTSIGAAGARVYDRQGLVQREVAAVFSLGAVPAALACGWLLAGRLDADVFIAVLGCLMVGLAGFVLVMPTIEDRRPAPVGSRRRALALYGSAVGALSGTFAVGGGLITVPVLARVQRLAPHRAAATTQAAAMAWSMAASIGHGLAGNVRWAEAVVLMVGAAVGSTGGARLAGRLQGRVVLMLLAAGLVVSGVPLLVRVA